MDTSLLEKFRDVIAGPDPIRRADSRLLMDVHIESGLEVYYAPFGYVKPNATIVIVGITPGPNQMKNAISAARTVLDEGGDLEQALIAAKRAAAFSDEPLRTNLINELRHWRVHELLGASSPAEFFEDGDIGQLVQTTSLLRFPAFKGGKPYRGAPAMTGNDVLKKYLHEYFVPEARLWRHAVVLPLGGKVSSVLEYLTRERAINLDNVLHGLLHPSGENNYRFAYLLSDDRTKPPPHNTNPLPYDNGRREFAARFLSG